MSEELKRLIDNYGRACRRDGNPAWESEEGQVLAAALSAQAALSGAGDAAPPAAITRALRADPAYAWAWHCNLAMPIMDAIGVTPHQANKASAHLMRHLFDIDVTEFDEWKHRAGADEAESQPAPPEQEEERPCTCHPDDNPPTPCAQKYALSECRASAAPAQAEQQDTNPPFANCSFRICDLPGQCRGEGKCHHPRGKYKQQANCTCGGGSGHTRSCPEFDESMMRYEPFGKVEQQGDGGARSWRADVQKVLDALDPDDWCGDESMISALTRALSASEQPSARDYLDTLTAVLNAIGYKEEFAAAHLDLKVSDGVKLFLAKQRGAIECQAHIGPDCTECGGTGFWESEQPSARVSLSDEQIRRALKVWYGPRRADCLSLEDHMRDAILAASAAQGGGDD